MTTESTDQERAVVRRLFDRRDESDVGSPTDPDPPTNKRVGVARLLTQIAVSMDGRQLPYAGVLRQAARLLLDVSEAGGGRCSGCSGSLEQAATGRRRRWCSEACRSRARRR